MELLIIAAVVIIGAIVYYNVSAGRKSLDQNQDGKVDIEDVKIAVDTARQGMAGDMLKVKTAVKKAAMKKPVAKKPAAKKLTKR